MRVRLNKAGLLAGFICTLPIRVGTSAVYLGELQALRSLVRGLDRNEVLLIAATLVQCILICLSDVINKTSPVDFLKGIAGYILLSSMIILVRKKCSSSHEEKYRESWLIGMGLAFALTELVSMNRFFVTNPWKFGLEMPVILIGGGLVSSMNSRYVEFINGLGLVAVVTYCGILMDSKNSYAVLAGIALSMLVAQIRKWLQPTRLKVLLVTGIICLIFACTTFSSTLTTSGLNSNSDNRGRFLAIDRTENIVSLVAILKRPLVGYGSYARDDEDEYGLFDVMLKEGVKSVEELEKGKINNMIPTHSALFAGMVWYGITGGIYWLYLLSLAIGGIWDDPWSTGMLTGFIMIEVLVLILTSPVGYVNRLLCATFIGILSRQRTSGVAA